MNYIKYYVIIFLSEFRLAFWYFRNHTCPIYTNGDDSSTDGPLVPMVGLVPIEKDVIPTVLLVNMHLIKGT